MRNRRDIRGMHLKERLCDPGLGDRGVHTRGREHPRTSAYRLASVGGRDDDHAHVADAGPNRKSRFE